MRLVFCRQELMFSSGKRTVTFPGLAEVETYA